MQFLCQRMRNRYKLSLHHLVVYFAPRLKQISRKSAFGRANAENRTALIWCYFAPNWFHIIFAPIQGLS